VAEPLVKFPSPQDQLEKRDKLRAAARQLERADLYIDAVLNMEVADRSVERTLTDIRNELAAIRGRLRTAGGYRRP
jgi:hypothetical protein